MRLIKLLFTIAFLFALFLTPAFAQDGETVPPPVNPISWTHLVISLLTPMVVWLVSVTIPKIPRNLLPLAAPVVGVVIGAAVEYITGLNLTWIDGAAAGGFGVFIRETVNQQITKRITDEG